MASETKFTPGPWAVVAYGDGDSLAVHDHRGDWRVCFMATPSKDGDFEGIEANARLIAAAPDLYEALAGLVRYADAVRMQAGMGPNQLARLDAAKAALNKASPNA